MNGRPKVFPIVGAAGDKPPDYERVVRVLSDGELRSELEASRGDEGYQEAVRAELRRRELPST